MNHTSIQLHNISRNQFQDLQDVDDKFSMPQGPIFLSSKTVSGTVSRQLNEGPAAEKLGMLKSVLSLFKAGPDIVDGAYGNTGSDEEAYRGVFMK